MPISRSAGTLLPLALFLLLAGSLPAQVRPMNLDEMTRAAGVIIVGTVTEAHGAVEKGEYVTISTIRVEQTIKGRVPSTYTVRQYGGQVGDRGMIVPHIRYLRTGERLLLMLYPPSSIGFTNPVGLNQGIWKINSSSVFGVTDEALRGLSGLMRKYRLGGAETQTIARGTFIAMIRDLIAATEGGR